MLKTRQTRKLTKTEKILDSYDANQANTLKMNAKIFYFLFVLLYDSKITNKYNNQKKKLIKEPKKK